ncbi:MAG: TIGR00374 family protein [Flavobacteriales bacterium]|nr:TIGR00374 family protein [Candidatus Arcticimaribacter sp.]
MIKFFKILLPLLIGILFIYLSVKDTTSSDRETIYQAVKNADYRFVFLSLCMGLLSHFSRAYRWNFMLHPMGYRPKLINNVLAIFITYIANLGVPRSGEFFRATVMKTYENIPFEKSFGTIIAERMVDLIMLFLVIGIALLLQFEFIISFLEKQHFNPTTLIISLVLLGFSLWILIKQLKKSSSVLAKKILGLIEGLTEGILTLVKMPKKWAYLFHTFLIWGLYVFMFYVVKLALPETFDLPFEALLIGFIVGAITISATNGGIGIYPFSVSLVLVSYGISKESSLAFGWIMWTAQTVMVIVFGSLSFFILPLINRKK